MPYGIPYSGLFSLGANFPEFHELVHYLRKFILGCYMKLDCGCMAIAEIGTDAIMSRWSIYKPKPWIPKYFIVQLQPKYLEWLQLGVGAYTANDKRPTRWKVWPLRDARLFSMCTTTANGLWILCQFTNKHLVYHILASRCSCTCVNFV